MQEDYYEEQKNNIADEHRLAPERRQEGDRLSPTDYNFEEVLGLFEANGWKLRRIQGSYRVFTKTGEYPFTIPVENKKVKVEYVEEIKQFFKDKQSEGRNPN